MTNVTIDLILDGLARNLTLAASPRPSFDDFLLRVGETFQLADSGSGTIRSFEYVDCADEESDTITVSLADEFADFWSFALEHSSSDAPVEITLSARATRSDTQERSDKVKDLLKQVEEAVRADPSLARDLEKIVDGFMPGGPLHGELMAAGGVVVHTIDTFRVPVEQTAAIPTSFTTVNLTAATEARRTPQFRAGLLSSIRDATVDRRRLHRRLTIDERVLPTRTVRLPELVTVVVLASSLHTTKTTQRTKTQTMGGTSNSKSCGFEGAS
ncbi:hypothetical protein JCM11491_000864 [Sporobolomyces phaffii]